MSAIMMIHQFSLREYSILHAPPPSCSHLAFFKCFFRSRLSSDDRARMFLSLPSVGSRKRIGEVVNVKGILRGALVTETSEIFQTTEIDQLGLLANLQALVGLSTDISEWVMDCLDGSWRC